ncbi:dynamin central domain-containing protein [Artemisia annua]|uniref:Dynamin central domain-containing protein n=1 Tax=Artemisia annua TaxID=35608 RepID=A0A2U1Q016_ARTAN|nr:dynamin central domain-containing protein [Artemisia annua]
MVKKRKVSLQLANVDTTVSNVEKPKFPPLVTSYNDKIRPILDAVDKLRCLKVNQEGISLPTIVVVGDQYKNLTSIPDAMTAFIRIVGSLKETLHRILIRGEFDQESNNKQMYCDARLVEMLDQLSKELHTSFKFSENFLVEEIQVLKEANGIRLPHTLRPNVFYHLLQREVNNISSFPISFVNKVWGYLEVVCLKVLIDHCGNYPQLLPSMRKALQNVMAKMKNKFAKRVTDMIEMEKITDYTCDTEFIVLWNKLKGGNQEQLSKAMSSRWEEIKMEGYGVINVKHLFDVPSNIRDQAFDLKMRMTAYWIIVLKRMVDWLALQLRFLMQKLVNDEIEKEIESKEIIEYVMDGILVNAD